MPECFPPAPDYITTYEDEPDSPCPLYYFPHTADNFLLLLLHIWGVIKIVWNRFITALLGNYTVTALLGIFGGDK